MASQLHLAHLNVDSAKTVDEILKILAQHNINVLALTVSNSVKNIKLEGHNFKLYAKPSSNKHHVFFYICSNLTVIKRSDLNENDLETIWVDIPLLDKRPMLVGCCFTKSTIPDKQLEKICEQIEMVSNEDKDILFLGEFKNEDSKMRIDFVSSVCGLTQINSNRVAQYTSTNIPHCYTSVSQLPAECSGGQSFTVARNLPTGTDALTEKLKPYLVDFKVLKVFDVLKHQPFTDPMERITQKDYNEIITQWTTDVKNKQKVGVIFIDFSFPSDVISYDQLIPKLKCSASAISMMRSFLFDEKSSSCWWKDAKFPKPREGYVTDFLLSVYTNNLKDALKQQKATFVMSGSQLIMYHIIDPEDLKPVLTDASNTVRHWLSKNKMVLKTFKSAMMTSEKHVDDIKSQFNSLLKFQQV